MSDKQEWFAIDEAPQDGSPIVGRYGNEEIAIRYVDQRKCMLAGIGGGNGYFGEGWEDTYNSLIIDPPEQWRHLREGEKP